MGNRYIILLLFLFAFCGCNKIPNQSVFEPIDAQKLNSLFQKDSTFTELYEDLSEDLADFNEIEKAKYHDVTYKGLYEMYQFINDTAQIGPLRNNWQHEWEAKFGDCAAKADSLILIWENKKKEYSLSRFVKIEFAELDKEYYSYSHDIKNVNFGFRVTPIDGPIEQLMFNYKYSAKINKTYGEEHRCICTSPIYYSKVLYWEASYSDEKQLKDKTSMEFIRDYDIDIEVTSVRKDGHNYSVNDLNIPSSIQRVLDIDNKYHPFLKELYIDDMITDQINSDYKGLSDYMEEKIEELLKKKYPREFALMQYIDKR